MLCAVRAACFVHLKGLGAHFRGRRLNVDAFSIKSPHWLGLHRVISNRFLSQLTTIKWSLVHILLGGPTAAGAPAHCPSAWQPDLLGGQATIFKFSSTGLYCYFGILLRDGLRSSVCSVHFITCLEQIDRISLQFLQWYLPAGIEGILIIINWGYAKTFPFWLGPCSQQIRRLRTWTEELWSNHQLYLLLSTTEQCKSDLSFPGIIVLSFLNRKSHHYLIWSAELSLQIRPF